MVDDLRVDDARTRLMRNKAAVASMVILTVLVVLAIIGQLGIWVHDYDTIYRDRVSIAPTLDNWHILGTDAQGRDLLARTLVGLGVSLMVGIVATLVSLLIGVTWGATAGFLGRCLHTIWKLLLILIHVGETFISCVFVCGKQGNGRREKI